MITINSFDTGLTQDDRAKLYPTCGHLHPDGLQELRRTDNYEAVKDVASRYSVRLLSFLFFSTPLVHTIFFLLSQYTCLQKKKLLLTKLHQSQVSLGVRFQT